MAKFQAPKGVSEYVPDRSSHFDYVRSTLINSAQVAGYQLVELPVFEDTELFARGVGESTDVVRKEMYTFEDRGGSFHNSASRRNRWRYARSHRT